MIEHEASIKLIEKHYFGNVETGDIDAAMACFTPDATVVIRHGDKPERVFSVETQTQATPLREFYQHLCGNYSVWFGEFDHYIDGEHDRAASRFTVRLTPKPGGLYGDNYEQKLLNCNFFEFRDGRISDMIIYYSNPDAGKSAAQASSAPTGYPPGD